jgi:hypothetical protein
VNNSRAKKKRGARSALTRTVVVIVGLLLTLSSCKLPESGVSPTPNQAALETMVAATLQAVKPGGTASPTAGVSTQSATPTTTVTLPPATTPTALFTPTPAPNVTGKVCYPTEGIPAMTAYFQETTTNKVVELPIATNQTSYKINLPAGTYIAYAWMPDFSLGGLYSNAVPCGLKTSCKDHTPLPFTVTIGETLTGIDLCDWYAGPFNIPYPPGKDLTKLTGSISGRLTYPSGSIPALRVVAFNVGTRNWYYINTNPGAGAYTISDLPPGTYHVVAYDARDNAGGYADANHELINVVVNGGEKTSGADITDWNAPPGTFPPDPTQ